MKNVFIRIILALIVTAVLGACSQTAAPTPEEPTAMSASQLLARAMADVNVRQYVADHFEQGDGFAELTTEQLHTDAFYQVLAEALGQSESLASVEAAFSALPNAYLIAHVNYKSWKPLTDAPLITFLPEGAEVGATVTAFDTTLTPYTFSSAVEPEQVVFVLHEGFADEPEALSVQGISCTLPGERGKFETRTTTMVDVKGKGQRGVAREAARQGWVIQNVSIAIDKSGNAGASKSLVSAGSQFIYLAELKQVRDAKLNFAGTLTDKQVEVKAAISSTYEQFIKYTTETVNEQTVAVEWYVDTQWITFASRIKVVATIQEMCNNVDASSVTKTTAVFDKNIANARSGTTPPPTPVTTGKLGFSVYPTGLTSVNLTVKGGGKTYSAGRDTVLTLPAGSYTVSGSGYDSRTNTPYSSPNQAVSVTSGGSKTLAVYMQSEGCGNPSDPNPIHCP